jgi:hypothetical protein
MKLSFVTTFEFDSGGPNEEPNDDESDRIKMLPLIGERLEKYPVSSLADEPGRKF